MSDRRLNRTGPFSGKLSCPQCGVVVPFPGLCANCKKIINDLTTLQKAISLGADVDLVCNAYDACHDVGMTMTGALEELEYNPWRDGRARKNGAAKYPERGW